MLQEPDSQAASVFGFRPLSRPRLSSEELDAAMKSARNTWETETDAVRKEELKQKYVELCTAVGNYARYIAACPTRPPAKSLWDLLKLTSRGAIDKRIKEELGVRYAEREKEENEVTRRKNEGNPIYLVHDIAKREIEREIIILVKLRADVASKKTRLLSECMDLFGTELDEPRKRLHNAVSKFISSFLPIAESMSGPPRNWTPPPPFSERQGSPSGSLAKAQFRPITRRALL